MFISAALTQRTPPDEREELSLDELLETLLDELEVTELLDELSELLELLELLTELLEELSELDELTELLEELSELLLEIELELREELELEVPTEYFAIRLSVTVVLSPLDNSTLYMAISAI